MSKSFIRVGVALAPSGAYEAVGARDRSKDSIRQELRDLMSEESFQIYWLEGYAEAPSEKVLQATQIVKDNG